MSTIWLKQFGGVDARRLAATTAPDSLIEGTDVHVTRGGEIEKRAAFVATYTLPAGTKSLAATAAAGVYVFGEGTDPGVPAGVTYQQLANGIKVLDRVVSWDLFEDKIYAAAAYTSGDVLHFYDGEAVKSRGSGTAVLGACAVRYDPAERAGAAPEAWAPAYGADPATARVWYRG